MTLEHVAWIVGGLASGFAFGSMVYVMARSVFILRRVGFDE